MLFYCHNRTTDKTENNCYFIDLIIVIGVHLSRIELHMYRLTFSFSIPSSVLEKRMWDEERLSYLSGFSLVKNQYNY